jgi:hypothetical protein
VDGARLLIRTAKGWEELSHVDEISARIANGHGWEKHLKAKDLPLGVTNIAEYAGAVHDIVWNGQIRRLECGRWAFWYDGSVAIVDPASADFGAAFVPKARYKVLSG